MARVLSELIDWRLIANLNDKIKAAAWKYEAKWALNTLRRTDNELYSRLVSQEALYCEALSKGSNSDIEAHGAALVRGWQAAYSCLDQANVAEDPYIQGKDRGEGNDAVSGRQT
jgi:hypothetical protein